MPKPLTVPTETHDELTALINDYEVGASIDARIASLLGIAVQPFTSDLAAAYALLDLTTAGDDYVNVDFREYRNSHIICDINDDTGHRFEGSERDGKNRAHALTGAILSALDWLIARD